MVVSLRFKLRLYSLVIHDYVFITLIPKYTQYKSNYRIQHLKKHDVFRMYSTYYRFTFFVIVQAYCRIMYGQVILQAYKTKLQRYLFIPAMSSGNNGIASTQILLFTAHVFIVYRFSHQLVSTNLNIFMHTLGEWILKKKNLSIPIAVGNGPLFLWRTETCEYYSILFHWGEPYSVYCTYMFKRHGQIPKCLICTFIAHSKNTWKSIQCNREFTL